MSCDMFASVWPKYLNLVHQTVSRVCRYGLGTRLLTVRCWKKVLKIVVSTTSVKVRFVDLRSKVGLN